MFLTCPLRRVGLNNAYAPNRCTGFQSQGSSRRISGRRLPLLLTHITKSYRGVCGAGICQAQRSILHPKTPFLLQFWWLGHGHPLSPYHTQLGRQSWFPPLGRMETPNLTTLWRRERLHPLSTSQPASQRPRSLGSCTVRARGAWCLSRVCSLEGYKRFFLLSSALNSLPCQLQNMGLERNVDIIAKQCIQFP